MSTKVCRVCDKEKPVEEFHFLNRAKGYRQNRCKKCNTEYTKQWRRENPERVKASSSKHQREAIMRLRREMLEVYGSACQCCGETDPHFLNLDHIDGVPDEHRHPSGKRITGLALLRKIKREGWPDSYRLLCWNCNCSLGIYGFCPHQPHDDSQRRYPLDV